MLLPEQIDFKQLQSLPDTVALSTDALKRIQNNRQYLEQKLKEGKVHYGINTGFGSLCNVVVPDTELSTLQENLVCSHACGFGDKVPKEIVRWMLYLKIKGLSVGYSGVREELVQFLVAMYNKNILPVIYEQGSLGASGDLAPLAHLSLPILGKGQVYYKGSIVNAKDALAQEGLSPLRLAAKEGLALLNGTQFMSAYGTWSLLEAKKLSHWADVIAALSGDAFLMRPEPFNAPIHQVRNHKGQQSTAQYPYSFRCVPQVHGACKDTLQFFEQVITDEVNAVTDNPLVFHDHDLIVSGGNFHGQPIAMPLDYLAIAMAELANISERRTYLLISGQRALPAFLAPNAGLNSGFMIAQYTAASIVSQNKQLCSPASVDSIVSSNGQEDHVSMGANAATKLYKVLHNLKKVLAIELLCAAQALDMRRPAATSPMLEKLHAAFRKEISFMDTDRVLYEDMLKAVAFMDQYILENK